jgi:TonB-dependent SusC/RagA subfamily outer membrane receptor
VTQKVPVGALAVIDVSLVADVTSLDEVVVVGYTTQKKATLTGAVSVIDNKDIVRTKNENVLNSMTGKLPGVRIIQKSAAPGAYDTQIDIRGMGDPLFVIDGIVRDKDFFARMTSEEIESVSILKDGTAAIYGLRAANGVVLVTTKRGTSQNGKVDIILNTSASMQQFLYVPKSVGAIDYMTLVNEKNAQDFGKNYLDLPRRSLAMLPSSRTGMELRNHTIGSTACLIKPHLNTRRTLVLTEEVKRSGTTSTSGIPNRWVHIRAAIIFPPAGICAPTLMLRSQKGSRRKFRWGRSWSIQSSRMGRDGRLIS